MEKCEKKYLTKYYIRNHKRMSIRRDLPKVLYFRFENNKMILLLKMRCGPSKVEISKDLVFFTMPLQTVSFGKSVRKIS